MSLKTSSDRLVEFLTTSSRIAHVARRAAKRSKVVARYAAIHELGPGLPRSQPARRRHPLHVVVLSHADDDQLVLSDTRMAPVIAHAFHLLFTEPSTHPDRVAQWMRRTNIRSEHRLHIVRVENLEAPQVSDLLARLCHAFRPELGEGRIVDAYLAGKVLYVRGPQRRMLHVPVESVTVLRNLSATELQDFRIDPDGSFIHWPGPDIHLGWNQLLQIMDPLEVHKAQQRSADFNRRYGAAIRKLREEAGIPQAKVEGITQRQLRRVEQGDCRATANALHALARAHKLGVNEYMEKVANAMS